ncbi:nitrogen regulation protein NR(II) [Alcanivorax sp. 1008]|uniref:two-component system sensor histidine kinase NtrB n=1 Tax=Alcanivorax sp. 1008 TaxID=2816853 RepID=UPI001E0E0C0D|nr:HAMP domain-containing sensor histidine kinase [Alcanivorax sp. 1008]MCC1496549.1 HAMP domain-containing histidine kinase [Alcanivorax sp. 1008]
MTDRYIFWTPARVYAAYRVVLAVILVVVFYLAPSSVMTDTGQPALFIFTAVIYLIITLISAALMSPLRRRFPNWSSLLPIVADIVLLTLLIHASGGTKSTLSVLLMVTVASASILLPGRGGLLVAALASMTVMFEQFWFSIQLNRGNPWHLTESAMLGFAFFVTAIIIHLIAQRLALSEALAETRHKAIEQLEELNWQIIQRMRTGIIVFDRSQRIVRANKAAEALMVSGSGTLINSLLPPALISMLRQWHSNPMQHRPAVQLIPGGATVLVRFAMLENEVQPLTLAFLEDQRKLAQEAQQLKLASLGRMSATIAHEIRNPLSAISHATGLLAEAQLEDGDRRLLDIVSANVARMNGIINDVLNLSRRQSSAAERIVLSEFIGRICKQWHQRGKSDQQIRASIPANLNIRFDPGQLEQIIDNLIGNAFRHGGEDACVELSAGVQKDSGLPWLKVSDDGPGIPEGVRPNLFEPFFTTSHQGTGLGLFVCRELCESNQAQLDLVDTVIGASFMITFAHPDRVFQ